MPDEYGGGEAWSKDYDATTCADWNTEMSSAQQLTVASDLLIGRRERNGGGSDLPDAGLVEEFRSAICAGAGDGDSVTSSATLVYFADQARFNQ